MSKEWFQKNREYARYRSHCIYTGIKPIGIKEWRENPVIMSNDYQPEETPQRKYYFRNKEYFQYYHRCKRLGVKPFTVKEWRLNYEGN
jgi:ribosomal protein S14